MTRGPVGDTGLLAGERSPSLAQPLGTLRELIVGANRAGKTRARFEVFCRVQGIDPERLEGIVRNWWSFCAWLESRST